MLNLFNIILIFGGIICTAAAKTDDAATRVKGYLQYALSKDYDFVVDLTTGRQFNQTDAVTWYLPLISSGTCAKRGVLKLDFGAPGSVIRKRGVFINFWFSRPRGWIFNVGDSRSNKGFGGDFWRRTGRDAELSGRGSTLYVYSNDYNSRSRRITRGSNVLNKYLSVIIEDGVIMWTNWDKEFNVTTGDNLFSLNGQPDIRNNLPNFDIYVGLNRVNVYQVSRGTGLCAAAVTWLA